MKRWTPSARVARPPYHWCGGLAASILVLLLLGVVHPVAAQESENQAGLVVQFGDGSVHTACVDLGADGEATGEEVLRAAGFEALIDYTSGFGGGTVCKINSLGCNFPAEACFCQCTMKPSDPCIYWSYFHLRDGQWRYSNLGVSSFVVRPGDVQGWAWGSGSAGVGAQPALFTFEQICSDSGPVAPQLPTAESLRTATFTPLPPPSPTVPQPTVTRLPTATSVPSATLTTTASPPTSLPLLTTPASSPERRPSTTQTVTPSPTSSATPTLGPTRPATGTPTAQTTPSEVERAATGPDSDKDSSPAISGQTEDEGSESKTNYLFFGLLIAILVGGLIFLRFR